MLTIPESWEYLLSYGEKITVKQSISGVGITCTRLQTRNKIICMCLHCYHDLSLQNFSNKVSAIMVAHKYILPFCSDKEREITGVPLTEKRPLSIIVEG